jgi:uncharacterized protein
MLLTDELLLQYKRCNRRSFLHFYGDQEKKAKEKDFCQKLKQEKISQAWQVLQSYNLPYQQPRILSEGNNNLVHLAQITEDLMSQGIECIYQGVIKCEFDYDNHHQVTVASSPTLLIKDESLSSRWGNWHYFAVNTHLGKSPKKEYKLISGLHARILSQIQEVTPQRGEIILRNSSKIYQTILSIWMPRSQKLVQECASMLRSKKEPEIFISRQRCSLCPWYDSCYDIAESTQHLSLIPGITPSRQDILRNQGISNFPLLAQTSLSSLQEVFSAKIAQNIYGQAQSLKSGNPIVKDKYSSQITSHNIELYFDVETEPDRNLHYLLGLLLVDRQNGREEYYSFMAKNMAEEEAIWHKFVDFVNQYQEAPIFHYSEYEVEIIKYLANRYQTPCVQLQSLLDRVFDLHKFLINSYFLPIQNYSLKSVANWLGFYWRDPQTGKNTSDKVKLAGDQCVFWYDQWLKTQESFWLDYILIYNYDDCFATYELKKWLDNY